MTNRLIAVLATAVIMWPLPADPSLDEQCAQPSYAKLHPTICDNGSGAPFLLGGGQGGGGAGGGGILGTIGSILGHLGL